MPYRAAVDALLALRGGDPCRPRVHAEGVGRVDHRLRGESVPPPSPDVLSARIAGRQHGVVSRSQLLQPGVSSRAIATPPASTASPPARRARSSTWATCFPSAPWSVPSSRWSPRTTSGPRSSIRRSTATKSLQLARRARRRRGRRLRLPRPPRGTRGRPRPRCDAAAPRLAGHPAHRPAPRGAAAGRRAAPRPAARDRRAAREPPGDQPAGAGSRSALTSAGAPRSGNGTSIASKS